MPTMKELEAKLEALTAALAERESEGPSAEILEAAASKGATPVVKRVALPACSWTIKTTDPIDGLIDKAAASTEDGAKAWSPQRMENLQYVADKNVGDVCGHGVTKLSINPATGEQYAPLCDIHRSMARTLKFAAWDNSVTKDRRDENETVFQAAESAAKAGKGAGGDVLVSNSSFAQYLVRVQGAEWDSGSARIRLAHGRAAFVAAVKAGEFKAGKRPLVMEA